MCWACVADWTSPPMRIGVAPHAGPTDDFEGFRPYLARTGRSMRTAHRVYPPPSATLPRGVGRLRQPAASTSTSARNRLSRNNCADAVSDSQPHDPASLAPRHPLDSPLQGLNDVSRAIGLSGPGFNPSSRTHSLRARASGFRRRACRWQPQHLVAETGDGTVLGVSLLSQEPFARRITCSSRLGRAMNCGRNTIPKLQSLPFTPDGRRAARTARAGIRDG